MQGIIAFEEAMRINLMLAGSNLLPILFNFLNIVLVVSASPINDRPIFQMGVLRPGYETSRSACYAAIFNPVATLVASPRCSARI